MSDSQRESSDQRNWLATCGFGLETVVRRELTDLGYASEVVAPGQVAFRNAWDAVCRTNLWLRTADRVVADIGRFPCDDFDTLFDQAREVPWEDWLGANDVAHVSGHSINSALSSVPACQRTVKKAIVERLTSIYGLSVLPETGVVYEINVGIVKDNVSLTIDTTGPSLHRRGYRSKYNRLWLKETLAAAMVLLSYWSPERPLIDPFCGSGTIPIEAALIGCRIAPGRNRSFAAEAWPQIPADLWEAARREADTMQHDALAQRILAMDVDEAMLRVARRDAEQAGVQDSIHFQPSPLDRMSSKRRYGCVITNPPWHGGRGSRDLESLYLAMPQAFRHLPTWSFFVLTDYPRFESLIGRDADRRRKLYNDRVRCTLYQFTGPKPPLREPAAETIADMAVEIAAETTAVEATYAEATSPQLSPQRISLPDARRTRREPQPPAFGALTEKAHEQAALFSRRLINRAKHLRRWPTRQGITCFRLYERDVPEIPLVVDRYEDYLHITEYERPHDRDPALHASWLDLMATTAGKTLEVPPKNVFLKRRERQRGDAQHQRVAETGREITVQEGGLKFLVNLQDYVDTGLFLDHRVTRSMVRDEARGKRFLNLFAYTGAFTVYAADGGAAETTTIDWSNAYIQWAQRQMANNGFEGPQHRFVRSDALEFLRNLPLKSQFDLAVVDPPTFSNSKRTDQDWEVQSGYAELLNELLRRMPSEGVIYFSNNFRRFKFDPGRIEAAQIHEISRQTVPADFRNRRIHRCWRIAK